MDILIAQVCSKFGIDEAVARKALGQVLQFIKKHSGDFDMNTILTKLQGAQTLINKADEPLPRGTETETAEENPATGGIVGLIVWVLTLAPVVDILKKILGMFFGESATKMIDSAGDSAELVGKLKTLGISTEQGASMVKMLVSFMKENASPELVDELVGKIPALATLLGDSKKEE